MSENCKKKILKSTLGGMELAQNINDLGFVPTAASKILSVSIPAQTISLTVPTNLRVAALRTAAPPIQHESLNLLQQYRKIQNELFEVQDALFNPCKVTDLNHAAIEVWDVITACSTMLTRLEEAGVDISKAADAMYHKNAERDYYVKLGAGIHAKKNSINRY